MDTSISINTVTADASETQIKVVDGDGDDLRHSHLAVDVREKHKKDCERKQKLQDTPTKGRYMPAETFEYDICAPYYTPEEQVKCPLKGKRTMSEQFTPPTKFTQFDPHRIVHQSRKGTHLNDPDAFQTKPSEIRSEIERVPLLPKLGCSQVSFVARKNVELHLEMKDVEVKTGEKSEVPASDRTSKLVQDPKQKIPKVFFEHESPTNPLLETPSNPLLEPVWKKRSEMSFVFAAAHEPQLHWGDVMTETPAESCGLHASADSQVYEIPSIIKPLNQHEGVVVHDIFNGPCWKNPSISKASPAPNQAANLRPVQPRTVRHFTGDQCNLIGPKKKPSKPLSSTQGSVGPSVSNKDLLKLVVQPTANFDSDSIEEEEILMGLSSPTMESKAVCHTVDMDASTIGDSIPAERTHRHEQHPTKPRLLKRLFSCIMCVRKHPEAADSESEVYAAIPHESRAHNSIVNQQSPNKRDIKDNKHRRRQTSCKLK